MAISDRMRKVLDLRKSSAAQPVRSKKLYTRKQKHKKADDDR